MGIFSNTLLIDSNRKDRKQNKLKYRAKQNLYQSNS